MRGEGQRLAAHLNATFSEIERLRIVYYRAIDQLENFSLPNLSPQSAAKWFEMYLRVVDLGVQIRRGEIRHRTAQRFTHSCMHKTGIKGAVHSGLSIDDGNAIYELAVKRKLFKESRLDDYFMRIDPLDRDVIGSLDKRVSRCLEDFRRRSSAFYDRLEVNGKDPHEVLLVLGGVEAGASVLSKVKRTCFGPDNCSCEEDATPWEDFCLKSGDPHAQNLSSANGTKDAQVEDVGIMDIKRQMGFEELSREEKLDDAEVLERDAAELARYRKTQVHSSPVVGGLRTPPSARVIYQTKCEANGSKPNPQIIAVLTVKKGSHFLNLSGIGFHSAGDLQDLVDIFSTTGLPPVKELDVSNGFFNYTAFPVLCQLLRVPSLRQNIERLILRGLAVPRRADFAALLRLLTSESSSSIGSQPGLSSLKTLDISFNTLCYEGATQLKPLLASLQRLEYLSLESCFPEPVASLDSAASSNEENVRAALAEVTTRLERLNFGSNCVAIESRWLDALFTPGSTVQNLNLHGISSSPTSVGAMANRMDIDGQFGEAWDLQQVITLKWSSSSSVLSEKLLSALSAELQGAFAQLKHLDIEVTIAAEEENDGMQAARKVADGLTRLAEYAALRSCRICCYSRNGTISPSLNASVGRLLEDGLHECEVLSLRMPQLYLTPAGVRDLLSCSTVPKMRRMTLAVGLTEGGPIEQNYGPCFLHMQSMQELILELHVPAEEHGSAITSVGAASIALARVLEVSWLTLSSSAGDFKQDEKLVFGRATVKLNRSFVLSERSKANKRIYQCRFVATPTPM